MEEIISFKDGTSSYILDDDIIPTNLRKSITPMYGVLVIDSVYYQCLPSKCNSCENCAFYNDGFPICNNLPCTSVERLDNQACYFLEVEEESFDNVTITTEYLKKLTTYRFKI